MRLRTRLFILLLSAVVTFVATLGGIFYADHRIDQSLASIREAYAIVAQVSQLNRLGTEVNAAGLPRVKHQWTTKAASLRRAIESYEGAPATGAYMLRELNQLDRTFDEILRIYQEESSPGFSGDFSKARFYRLNHLTVLLHSLSTMAERIASEKFAKAKEEQNRRDIYLIVFGLIWCLAAALWSLTLWNGITTPVRNLLQGIYEVGNGNLDHRVTYKGSGNELNEIIRSFNAMLDRLQSLKVSRKRLLDTAEQERGRIGRELHDGICQSLAAMRLRATNIQNNDPVSMRWMADNLLSLQNEVQRIVKDLRPAMLDELGLLATLSWFAEQNAHQIEIRLCMNIQEEDIPQDLHTPIFRIIQESTNNAVRHGRASTIHVQITRTDHEIDVTIEDNGCGFNSAKPSAGNGLPGIRERVEAEKGHLTIDSSPGRGCCIMASFQVE